MPVNKNKISAELFQLIVDNKVDNIFNYFSVKEVKNYLNNISSPNFGSEGDYVTYFSSLNSTWQFHNPREKAFFELLHDLTGCFSDLKNNEYIRKTIFKEEDYNGEIKKYLPAKPATA